MMLVKTDKCSQYPVVYKLLKLVLVVPVTTAGVERIFSAMNFIRNKLRTKMGQKYLNDCLATLYSLKGNYSCKLKIRTSSLLSKVARIEKLIYKL